MKHSIVDYFITPNEREDMYRGRTIKGSAVATQYFPLIFNDSRIAKEVETAQYLAAAATNHVLLRLDTNMNTVKYSTQRHTMGHIM